MTDTLNKPVNWQDIQENTFTRWCNDMLASRGRYIHSLKTDLKDGINLIHILEVASEKSLGNYHKHPKIEMQKTENLIKCFEFIKQEKIKLVNIGPEDILRGNMRLILGLIWTLILNYEIGEGGVDELLAWVQKKVPALGIKNWTSDWNDGRAVCALTDAMLPGLIPDALNLDPNNKAGNCKKGIDTAASALQVDPLILPEEMSHPKVDKLAVQTYVAQFRNISENELARAHEMLHGKKKQPFHLMSNAFGPGLVEAIKDTPANFSISVPSDFKDAPKLSISGPNDDCKFNIQKDANGLYNVTYTPKNAGDYEISITVGGEPIEGSSFKVPVLLQESLGGEGLIRVFYSTTSSTAKGRSDVKNLEKLLVEKKVHLRKNFEPWHAVDIMDRPDREAVFRRAGTRNLPIVFVNDEYIGDYDAVSALEEAGKLDRILNLSDRDMVTLEQHMERLKAAAE